MDFDAALAYLSEHDNLETTEGGPRAGVVHGLSLERMRGIVEVLGDPHRTAPVIHVTGTNGKGSVCRMISTVLGAHGLTVGTFASPHLETIRERIRRNADLIGEDEFAEVVAEVAAVEPLFPERPSYFDLLTAVAFSWFAREAVEVMVVEVGMLGRYDSTNVVDADVAVITNVGRDHTDGVGEWRRAIAEEKAGIIGPDSAVIIGETDPELVEVFRDEGGALHWVRDEHFGVRSSVVAVGGRQADLYTPASRLEELFIPVHGAHQVDNAAVAVAAVEAFFGRQLDRDVVAEGLSHVEMPGRFEVVSRTPLVVVDMAHNPDGTATTAATLRGDFQVTGRLHLVLGCLGGRPLDAVLAPLVELGPQRITCTRPDSVRAVDPDEVAAVARRLAADGDRVVEVHTVVDPAQAVTRAARQLQDDDALVVVGSVYLAGVARAALRDAGVAGSPFWSVDPSAG